MVQDIQFEKALERLEKIVQDLETGDISLEDALKKYEEGVKLSRSCQEKLTQAEKKIEVLAKVLNGKAKKEAFDVDEEGEKASTKTKKKTKASKQAVVDDEDVLF